MGLGGTPFSSLSFCSLQRGLAPVGLLTNLVRKIDQFSPGVFSLLEIISRRERIFGQSQSGNGLVSP